MEKQYIAIVDKVGRSYGVTFPDFPGCVAKGRSTDDAVAKAVEALSEHVETMTDHGKALPEPTALDDLPRSMDDEDVVAITLIGVEVPETK